MLSDFSDVNLGSVERQSSCFISIRCSQRAQQLPERAGEESWPSDLAGPDERAQGVEWTQGEFWERAELASPDPRAADRSDDGGGASRHLPHEGHQEAADGGRGYDVTHQLG